MTLKPLKKEKESNKGGKDGMTGLKGMRGGKTGSIPTLVPSLHLKNQVEKLQFNYLKMLMNINVFWKQGAQIYKGTVGDNLQNGVNNVT